LREEFWEKYGYEVAKAWLYFGFIKMNIQPIYASAHIKIVAQILEKLGLRLVSEYNHDGIPCVWYELDKINYQNENNKIAGVPEHFNLPWHLAIENKV
jgi:hypothetical protein